MKHWLRFAGRRKLEQDLHEELAAHLAIDIQQRIGEGNSPEKARLEALRELRSLDMVKENTRDIWIGKVEKLAQDIRLGFAMIRRAPAFTSCAVLILALGIGGTTTMFSVVNGVLLRDLPYREPYNLVAITASTPQVSSAPLSAYYIEQWRARSETIEAVAAVGFANSLNLTGEGDPQRVNAVRVSAGLFPMLGVTPQYGRNFLTSEEQEPGSEKAVILSSGFWTRQFGRDPKVLGSRLQLNGESYQIVGVMPPDFRFPKNDELHRMIRMPEQTDLWLPLVFTREETLGYLHASYAGIARVKNSITTSASEMELNRIIAESALPKYMAGLQIHVTSLQTQMVGRVQQGLYVLMIAVCVVLLISCLNVSNLMLVRAQSHQYELAVRAALGAGRVQLVRMALIESSIVAIFGALGGTVLAFWLIEIVRAYVPYGLPRVDEVAVDLPTLTATIIAACSSAIVCAAAPAWRFYKTDPGDALHEAGRNTTSSRRENVLRAGFVSLQSALCVVLMVVAGLLVHSFMKITGLDQGFRAENVVAADVALVGPRYAQPNTRALFFNEVLANLEALPGVQSAGAVSNLPLTGETNLANVTPEKSADLFGGGVQGEYRIATPGYFATVNIPLLRGKLFTDRPDEPKTAVISQRAAEKLWPEQDPIGKRFERRNRNDVFVVVGVVGNVRSTAPDREPAPMVYLPLAQQSPGGITLVVRSATDSAAAVRQAVHSVDQDVPIFRIRNADEVLENAFAIRRFQALLLTAFATVALLLTAIGIYGIVASSVTQQRREIGIRLALGASKGRIVERILLKGLEPVILGMVVGTVAAVFAARAIQSFLYDVTPFDFWTYAVGLVVLLVSAVVACLVPMCVATRLDPMMSIRYE